MDQSLCLCARSFLQSLLNSLQLPCDSLHHSPASAVLRKHESLTTERKTHTSSSFCSTSILPLCYFFPLRSMNANVDPLPTGAQCVWSWELLNAVCFFFPLSPVKCLRGRQVEAFSSEKIKGLSGRADTGPQKSMMNYGWSSK